MRNRGGKRESLFQPPRSGVYFTSRLFGFLPISTIGMNQSFTSQINLCCSYIMLPFLAEMYLLYNSVFCIIAQIGMNLSNQWMKVNRSKRASFGGVQVDVAGLEKYQQAVDNADQRLERGIESVRDSV
jgi:hypothetical protein